MATPTEPNDVPVWLIGRTFTVPEIQKSKSYLDAKLNELTGESPGQGSQKVNPAALAALIRERMGNFS